MSIRLETIEVSKACVGEASERFPTFPFVAKVGENYACFVPGQNSKNADMDYLHPYVVSAGLTLELKLKQLLAVENGKQERGHNLLALYKSLNSGSKSFISSYVASRAKNSVAHQAISEAAMSNFNLNFKWEVEFLLEKSAYAFERWRYLYEAENSGSWFAGYIEIYDALDNRFNSINSM